MATKYTNLKLCSFKDSLSRFSGPFTAKKASPKPVARACLPEDSIVFSVELLDQFRTSVGRYKPETGGMLACKADMRHIDVWCFDQKARNTSASYSYDVEEMSAVFRHWKELGYRSTGFVHSHPRQCIRPSYADIATGHTLMKFFGNSFFYLPILMPHKNGLYTMYFYVLRLEDDCLNVDLEYVLQAEPEGYSLPAFSKWHTDYSVSAVESYYYGTAGREVADHSKAASVLIPNAADYVAVGHYYMQHQLQNVISGDLLQCFDAAKLGRLFAQKYQGHFVKDGFLYQPVLRL